MSQYSFVYEQLHRDQWSHRVLRWFPNPFVLRRPQHTPTSSLHTTHQQPSSLGWPAARPYLPMEWLRRWSPQLMAPALCSPHTSTTLTQWRLQCWTTLLRLLRVKLVCRVSECIDLYIHIWSIASGAMWCGLCYQFCYGRSCTPKTCLCTFLDTLFILFWKKWWIYCKQEPLLITYLNWRKLAEKWPHYLTICLKKYLYYIGVLHYN